MDSSAWFSRPRPWVIAHRGASQRAPENTLAAFRLAFELGADAIELDTRLTVDGHVVVLHDASLERTTTGRGAVAQRSLRELKELDAGSHFGAQFAGERIPTLEEVFESIGAEALVNIEVANYAALFDRLPETVAELARSHGWEKRILISSYSPIALRKMRKLLPGVPLGVLVGPNRPLRERILTPLLSPYDFVHAQQAYALVRRGPTTVNWDRPLVAWTVNEPAHMETLVSRTVAGIITDVPDVARAIVDRAAAAG